MYWYVNGLSTVIEMKRMTPRHTLLALAAVISIVATACSPAAAPESLVPPASTDPEIAPLFTVPTADGGEFSLAEHIANDGRPLFLNLWASWCFPCREEMPAIDNAARDFPEIAFIGVSIQDSRSDAEAFLEEIGVTFMIGFDDDDAVDASYTPLGLPASYIISPEGVIVERIFGKVTEESLAEKFEKHFGL